MKKTILLAIVLSAFLTTLVASVYACGDGSSDITLVNGELPGGG